MSSSLLWRSQVAVHPAVSIGLHRVGADLSLVDEAAFDASQCPVLKAGTSCGNTLDFHARLAFETTRPRRRPMRWRGRLRIGQQCLPWNAAGALSNSLSPMKCRWRSSDGVVCAAPGAGCWSILLSIRKLRGQHASARFRLGVKGTPDGASVRCWAESSDQYRTTTMMAMTMMAAISESARSNVFERVPAEGTSSGGMT